MVEVADHGAPVIPQAAIPSNHAIFGDRDSANTNNTPRRPPDPTSDLVMAGNTHTTPPAGHVFPSRFFPSSRQRLFFLHLFLSLPPFSFFHSLLLSSLSSSLFLLFSFLLQQETAELSVYLSLQSFYVSSILVPSSFHSCPLEYLSQWFNRMYPFAQCAIVLRTTNWLSLSSAVLGFPRMGRLRDLKKATEAYWGGKLSRDDLIAEGKRLRQEHWKIQKDAGVDIIPSNDFAFYDQVLDHIQLFGVCSPASLASIGPVLTTS